MLTKTDIGTNKGFSRLPDRLRAMRILGTSGNDQNEEMGRKAGVAASCAQKGLLSDKL